MGHVVVDKPRRSDFEDITASLARKSGFAGIVDLLDLLKIAKHCVGENVHLVEFHQEPPARKATRT